MGKRLSKIYTRTGDKGETGLGDGKRIPKDDIRIQAIGTVDELNSHMGLLIAELKPLENPSLEPITALLTLLQHRLFDLGGELSIPDYRIISARHVSLLENAIDQLNSELAPLENFILPGGSRLIATCHLVRSICRRAERDVVALSRDTTINQEGARFLNRLSDYLFVAARYIAMKCQIDEILWQRDEP